MTSGPCKAIAKAVRESDGGLPRVKAMGVELASRGMVQVSMNLTDYHVTPPHLAFEAVKREAANYKLEMAGSELIGLVPQDALDGPARHRCSWSASIPPQILDVCIRAAMSGRLESDPPLDRFSEGRRSSQAHSSRGKCRGARGRARGVVRGDGSTSRPSEGRRAAIQGS